MAETLADDAETPPEGNGDQANLSDLVKEIVKDMDGDDFYAKPDMYDESLEVRRFWFQSVDHASNTKHPPLLLLLGKLILRERVSGLAHMGTLCCCTLLHVTSPVRPPPLLRMTATTTSI